MKRVCMINAMRCARKQQAMQASHGVRARLPPFLSSFTLSLAILLVLAACAPSGSVTETKAPEEAAPSASEAAEPITEPITEPATVPREDRVAAITPARGEDVREKKTENADAVGWLTVPGTDVDSVIVQAPAEDNGFYTNHDFDGSPSRDGAYCADNRADFSAPTREGISQNVALYGHNWDENPDGRLFAQLKRFRDPAFAKAHPYVFFSTGAEDMAYEVFAVYDVTVDQPYIIPDLPWASLSEVLELAYEASLYDYGIRLDENDKILTLSTCSFEPPGREPLPLDRIPDYRFVVMARLVPPDGERKEEAAFTVNGDPLIPDAMPVIYSHHADVIQYGGKPYDNQARFHAGQLPEIDPASLVPAGEILRSGVMRDLEDFDATILPEGTPLYRARGDEGLLVAKVGDVMAVYA